MLKDADLFKNLHFNMNYAESIMDEVWKHMRDYKMKACEQNRGVEFEIIVGNVEYAKLVNYANEKGIEFTGLYQVHPGQWPKSRDKTPQLIMFGWPVYHKRESRSMLTIKGRIK